jgi:hypothetical protein
MLLTPSVEVGCRLLDVDEARVLAELGINDALVDGDIGFLEVTL